MGSSKTGALGADVAPLMPFQPADPAHAADWPIAWCAAPFLYPAESAAARLLA